MGTMKTADDPKNYQPTTLIAPDGREFTPSSLREHNEVVGLGYRPAPAPAVDDVQAPSEPQEQAETTAPAEPGPDTAQSETPSSDETSAPAEPQKLPDAAPSDVQFVAPAPTVSPDAPASPAPLVAPRRKAGGK